MKLVGAVLLLACVGCHAGSGAPQPAGATQSASASASGSELHEVVSTGSNAACCSRCPLALPGVTLKFAQSTAGGSLLFSAPDAELEELRDRVRELAAFHNHENSRLAMVTMPHHAEAFEIDGGAQLKLSTAINNDVQTLQQEIENEVQWMQGGRCPGADQLECTCQLGAATPLSSAAASEATSPAQ